jgi:hypothetical protein
MKEMSKFSKKMFVLLGVCFLFLTALSQAAENATPSQFKPSEKFYVYKDKPSLNRFIASGFMPDGKCVEMNDAWVDNCQDSRSCVQVKFDRDCTATGTGWAGAYWLSPANNWGDIKGGYNLTGAKTLVFWARGEKGGEVVTFKMGGVGMGHSYPDSDGASSDPITLTKEWKEYSIDLSGKDLSHIIGGFAWVGTAKENQSNITFYLRNIYYK